MLRCSLCFRSNRVTLGPGTFTLGRAPDCEVIVSDGLVSRHHARLVVDRDGATLEDLRSSNGIFVNGTRIEGVHRLQHGDQIVLGQEPITIQLESLLHVDETGLALDATLPGTTDPLRHRVTITEADALLFQGERADYGDTSRGNALELLGGVADKMLAMDRGAEAESVLAPQLNKLLDQARAGNLPSEAAAERAASYAVRLAAALRRPEWANFAIRLYATLGRPLPAATIDALNGALRRVGRIDLAELRGYIAALETNGKQLGPADAFLVQRLKGLERVASAR